MASAAGFDLASRLLSHLGGPSAMVTGQRSFLPRGDKLRMLLESMTPSLTARLSRRSTKTMYAVGPGRGGEIRPAARMAATKRSAVASPAPAATSSASLCPDRLTGLADAARATRQTLGPVRGAASADPSRQLHPDESCVYFDWPWDQPIRPAVPLSPADAARAAYVQSPPPGSLLDVFA